MAPTHTDAWCRMLASAGLAASLALLIGVSSARAEPVEEYVIQRGDTLWSIAEDHDVGVHELIEFNELADADLIYAGQTLLIPRGEAPSPVSEAMAVEVVEPPEDPSEWLPDLFRINQYCIQGRMSNGVWVHEGAVAAPGGLFPLGTVVEIEGLGTFTVSDRMGWSSIQMLDVWTPNCGDAFLWGTRFRQVRVADN